VARSVRVNLSYYGWADWPVRDEVEIAEKLSSGAEARE
jgi:hypothetical protein